MSKLLAIITNNPMVLIYIAALCFAAGLASGAIPAWRYQGALKDAVQARYDSFVAQTKTIGEQAAASAKAKAEADKREKERFDEQYKNDLADAAAVSQRLLDARANRGYLPTASATTRQPDRACFSRSGLESAMGYLDERGSDIAKQGNAFRLSLEIDKRWAQGR
ncbi:MAG: hypothetical protein WC714_29100 [Candidatus Obscuribacterales bacterium]